MASTRAQGARMGIGIVAERLDGAANLALNQLADRNCSIYHPGHSGCGDAGLFRNLSNVHVWSGSAALSATELGVNAMSGTESL